MIHNQKRVPWDFFQFPLTNAMLLWYTIIRIRFDIIGASANTEQNGDVTSMARIKTIKTRDLCKSAKNGGCGECQTSCQSACKTSCGVANQKCENKNN